MAFSTPFRMYKRYSYQGGICDPMVIHWPKGIKAKGEVRNQYHHVIDIVPTILDCIGMEFPQFVQGYEQTPLPGVSMKYSFDAEPDAPTTKETQYYPCSAPAASGTRAGRRSRCTARRRASATSTRTCGSSSTPTRTAPRRTTSPTSTPTRWRSWCGCGSPRPASTTCCRSTTGCPMEILMDERPSPFDAEGSYVFYPGTSDLPEHAAPNLRGRSFSIHATVELDEAAEGVLMAHGARFGGHSLFLKGGKLWYVNNFLGHPARAGAHVPRRRRRRRRTC